MITMTWRVETIIDHWTVFHLGNKKATYEGTQHVNTRSLSGRRKFDCLREEGGTEVRVGVEEKISGPSGTYSSVSVKVEIASRCNTDEVSIEQARDALFKEALGAVDHYMNQASNLLMEHTEGRVR